MLHRSLTDFRFSIRSGPEIVRWFYTGSFILLTLFMLGSAALGVASLRVAAGFDINPSLGHAGDIETVYWSAFLVALAPAYLGSLMLNRLAAELCLAVLSRADTPERSRSSDPAESEARMRTTGTRS